MTTHPIKRVAVITGAAGGLGLSVVKLLAASGHDLALIDVREDALTTAADELRNSGARFNVIPADLASVSECERVIAETIAYFGRIDILVNSAGVLARKELEDVTAESFDETFHVNARAPFFLTRAAIADMAKRRWGRVVNFTSIGVYRGGERMTSAQYEMSKGAVSVLTKMFAKYGASKGVLVNSVCPGAMKTRMILEGTPAEILQDIAEATPLKRIAEPIEVARMVAWLCSEENSYATGATFDIVGGWVMH
jgi:NAD(P)-dependent dehydrogenase (short-subunit alcohol dehydrogenase family)